MHARAFIIHRISGGYYYYINLPDENERRRREHHRRQRFTSHSYWVPGIIFANFAVSVYIFVR